MSQRTPALSGFLAYLPALILFAIGAAAWLLPHPHELLARAAGHVWGAAILLFLSGVRRGLSFFTEGGPRPAQVVTSLWLFVIGAWALVADPPAAFVVMAAGYLGIAVLDPIAARRSEVPGYFAQLRPPQMTIFLVGCLLLLFA
jgi:hypothetical protein